MTTSCRLLWLAFVGLFGCAEASPGSSVQQMTLPKGLREVSGLAIAPDGRLLAIADELGQLYSISFDEAKVRKETAIGDPPVVGDFEGLAILNDWIYATTSDGELYRRGIRTVDASRFERFETGIGKRCEVEGLAAHPTSDYLWLLCKEPRKKRYRGKLVLFAWSPETKELAPDAHVEVDFEALGFKKSISPSGVTFSTDGDELLIVAAREQSYIVTTPAGRLVRSGRLPNRRDHPQAEGIAAAGTAVYLADEGGKGKGRLTRYENGF
jgi:hypothetical protein